MNWADEPATWKQLQYLKSRGQQPNHRLTKTAASELIARLGGPPALQLQANTTEERPLANAYFFHQEVVSCRQALEQVYPHQPETLRQKLDFAVVARQEFWMESCRGTRMKIASPQALELYRKYGCLYNEPTQQKVQAILDALDGAMPFWNRDHPELFFQALALNFPELIKQSTISSPTG